MTSKIFESISFFQQSTRKLLSNQILGNKFNLKLNKVTLMRLALKTIFVQGTSVIAFSLT